MGLREGPIVRLKTKVFRKELKPGYDSSKGLKTPVDFTVSVIVIPAFSGLKYSPST